MVWPSGSIVPDAGDAIGDRVASSFALRTLDEQGLALVEQDPILAAIDGVERIHRDRAQAGAVMERLVPDAGDAVGNRDAGQAGAGKERTVLDVGDAIGDRVASSFAPWTLDEQRLALVEQDPILAAIDGVERIHRDRAQAGAVIERKVPDAGDRQAIDRAGNDHRPAWAGVSRDGDRAVIGRVIELGLHHGGQSQEQQQQQWPEPRDAGGPDRQLFF